MVTLRLIVKGSRRGRCGGEHEYGKCDPAASVKCSDCGGAHSVTYKECEARKKAAEHRKKK